MFSLNMLRFTTVSSLLLLAISFIVILLVNRVEGSLTVEIENENQVTIIDNPEVEQYTLKVSSCNCDHNNCTCCLNLDIPTIGFYFNGCGEFLYNSSTQEIEVIVTLNGKNIIDKKISAHNPPPVCFGKPYTYDLAEICIKLYNLDVREHHFKGCTLIEALLKKVEVVKIPLGCWDM